MKSNFKHLPTCALLTPTVSEDVGVCVRNVSMGVFVCLWSVYVTFNAGQKAMLKYAFTRIPVT